METLVTICARAGSKGLPGKNTKIMHGKPLIQWTIDQAEEWAIERGGAVIVVSSDDPTVKKIALSNNLFYVNRPPELARDGAGKVAAIRHAWEYMEHALNRSLDIVIDLDVTNPMRRMEDIEMVWRMAQGHQITPPDNPLTVFSVTKARRNPYFNQYPWPTQDGRQFACRQDAPKVWDLNCCIYAYSREYMLSDRQYPITNRSEIYEMPDWSAFDIDSSLDWEIVEFLMGKYFAF